MTDSLRDQLLKLGFTPPAKVAPKASLASNPDQTRQDRTRHDRTRSDRMRHGPATDAKPAGDKSQPDRHPRNHPRREQPRTSAHAPSQAANQTVPQARPPRPQGGRTQAEIDLGKAYALRAQNEKDERIEAERLKQEAARSKREAKAKVAELLKDNTLNDAAAELVRHFDYGGKIKRIHVNADQLKALNAGELGVVQFDGRYLLVTAEHARQTQALLPSLLALLVDPNAPTMDDSYADPAYRVPDDLVW